MVHSKRSLPCVAMAWENITENITENLLINSLPPHYHFNPPLLSGVHTYAYAWL